MHNDIARAFIESNRMHELMIVRCNETKMNVLALKTESSLLCLHNGDDFADAMDIDEFTNLLLTNSSCLLCKSTIDTDGICKCNEEG
jgi:hypothetical protein